jgi:hypothetical protein
MIPLFEVIDVSEEAEYMAFYSPLDLACLWRNECRIVEGDVGVGCVGSWELGIDTMQTDKCQS